ncbi:hypothetical protein [Psychroflexus tropicus]|uniref:hypothetical protein n=1 Tax=Psychroflexus tropicus TaxID=197345 RepID=UPI00036E4B3F|nr:hypothetical protein [Psychroflexus tropicus]
MKLKSLLGVLLLLITTVGILSCSNGDKKNQELNSRPSVPSELQDKIKLDSIRLVGLSQEAKAGTDEWMMYIALNSEVKRLEEYTIADLVNNAETINNVIDSLAQTVPKPFETNAVEARIRTLKTHSELLLDNSKRMEPEASIIEELSIKLKLDFNNLNIQLNEVYIMDNSNEVTN